MMDWFIDVTKRAQALSHNHAPRPFSFLQKTVSLYRRFGIRQIVFGGQGDLPGEAVTVPYQPGLVSHQAAECTTGEQLQVFGIIAQGLDVFAPGEVDSSEERLVGHAEQDVVTRYSQQLAQAFGWPGQVLQHLKAEHQVEGVVWEGQAADVGPGQWLLGYLVGPAPCPGDRVQVDARDRPCQAIALRLMNNEALGAASVEDAAGVGLAGNLDNAPVESGQQPPLQGVGIQMFLQVAEIAAGSAVLWIRHRRSAWPLLRVAVILLYSHPGGCQLHAGSREVGRSECHSDLLFAGSNAGARERGRHACLCNRPSCLWGRSAYSDVGPVGRNGIPTYGLNGLAGVGSIPEPPLLLSAPGASSILSSATKDVKGGLHAH